MPGTLCARSPMWLTINSHKPNGYLANETQSWGLSTGRPGDSDVVSTPHHRRLVLQYRISLKFSFPLLGCEFFCISR